MKKQALNEFYLGIDLGTSFIKVALVNSAEQIVDIVREPQTQMKIISQKQNYSEQDPQLWWKYTSQAIKKIIIKRSNVVIKGIGISYQMHGLVLIGKQGQLLRNSIIWADGRTKKEGFQLQKLMVQIEYHKKTLNYPGNFTLSKLKWVQQNQPDIFSKIHKFMLPGDYIAFKLTGQCMISQTGLSQGIMWNFKQNKLFNELFQLANIQQKIIPKIVKSFQLQGKVTKDASQQTLIPQKTPIFYRSGDQANNAYSLGVLNPGQLAAAGGTSGTIWFVTNKSQSLELTRINTFLHVNHSQNQSRFGKLLCINGCGKVYSWMKQNLYKDKSYTELNLIAQNSQSKGIIVIPFGNGPERMLNNRNVNFNIKKIDLNRHNSQNIIRATVEAIAFSFVYGINILKGSQKEELKVSKIKTASDNLFKSEIICVIIATLLDCAFQIYETTGAVGAALGAKQGFQTYSEGLNFNHTKDRKLKILKQITAKNQLKLQFSKLYQEWQKQLERQMKTEQTF